MNNQDPVRMQALQGNFSYLLNSRTGSNRNLENERQQLVQQQKFCKARARKFSLETNRRRKALDERRKQWDVQEQRLRENILQQRRQQVQDATQRFQRAHLPPSQRYRQTVRKNAPNMEEAICQIQGSLGLNAHNSSVLTNTCSCPLSTKPPTVSRSSHHRALSAVDAYAKLLQEQCTMEELHDHSPELSDSCVSDSLSSKDSLENEDSNHSTLSPHTSYSTVFVNIENLRKRHDLTPTSEPTSVPAMMLLDQNPARLTKVNKHEIEKPEDSKWTHNDMVVSKTSLRVTPEKYTLQTDNPFTLKDCDLVALFKPPNGDSTDLEVKCLINSHSDNILETNEVGAGDLYHKEDVLLDLKSQMIHDGCQLPCPSTKNFPFASGNGILCESTVNNHLNGKVLLHTEKENFQKKICVSINNLNKVSNLTYLTEKAIDVASLHASLSNIRSETERCDCQKEDEGIPVSVAATHAASDVEFLKGILKKQSTYTSEDSCLYDPGRIIVAKRVAMAIRDSIELTRARTKDVTINSGVKKKLRWFDEVHPEKDSKEQSTSKQDNNVSYSLSHPTNNSKDHPSSLTAESSKPGPRLTSAASDGYRFTKEAWTDVGVQVNLPLERADEVKALPTSVRTGVPRVPLRGRNGRPGGGPVSSRTRKGTVIRPQSVTEVSQLAKTQGKMLLPRPPPRPENTASMSTTQHTQHPSINYTVEAPSGEIFSPNKPPPATADSTVKYTITPVSYPCPVCPFSESNAKGTPSSGHQETLNNRERGKMNEKGLCLDNTPTDEEISQLWLGVCSALNTKDAKPVFEKQALESRRICRKPCAEQSRQPPGSGSRRLLQSSQPTNQNTELIRPVPRNCSTVSGNEGYYKGAAQFQMAEVYPEGLVKQNPIMTQTQRPERAQEWITNLSLEERKILLSLDRLNHQLYSLKEHQEARTDNNAHQTIGTPFTKEVSNLKPRVSSASQLQYQKKI